MAQRCPAGKALISWIEREGLTQAQFARDLGVANAVLWRWLAGRQLPRLDFCLEIERLTKGTVPSAMWMRGRMRRAA